MKFMRFSARERFSSVDVDEDRIYAIGDIHGRLDLLGNLCRQLEVDVAERPKARRVRIVLLGDLIDRGPHSRQLLELCMQLKGEDRITIIKGNHEAALVDAWNGNHDALELWLSHGGDATLASFGVDLSSIAPEDFYAWMRVTRASIPKRVIDWISRLPTHLWLGNYYFVHAGVRPGVPLADQTDADRLWIRDEFLMSTSDHGAMIVHGHAIESERVRIHGNRIGIDTGAYKSNRLSAVAIQGDERWVIST